MESMQISSNGKIIIGGPQYARGTIKVSGAKNSVLPIMACAVLTDDEIVLRNAPDLADVNTMVEILEACGKKVERKDKDLIITKYSELNSDIPYETVRKARATFNVYGPLAMRLKNAKVALPGGCSIGVRPVNFHLEGLKKLGIISDIEHGYAVSTFEKKEGEISVYLPFPSVGATEHIISAATLLKNSTVKIYNCALEPEISDMIDFLCEMGAKISGKNTSVITVEGVEKLNGCTYEVIPDRIEAGTWMILGALKGKELVVEGVIREHLESLFSTFDSIGIPYVYDSEKRTFKISAVPFSELNGAVIDTAPFPGFPTDLQPQIMVLLALINGKSIISEKIFNRRYYHIDELNRMGAKINVDETNAIIQGVEKLTGAPVQATDLRAAAALVLAGITAEGETVISNVDHIFRGYEKIIEKLSDIDIKIRYAI